MYKDTLQLSFFLDLEDPDAQQDADALWERCCSLLLQSGAGAGDTRHFNAQGGFVQWTFAGNDADALLVQLRPLVLQADCVIGPRVSLICRQRGSSSAQVRHIDL